MPSAERERAKRQFIRDMKAGDSVDGLFAVRGREVPREYRNKPGKYFILTVSDRTGTIEVKYWGGENEERIMEVFSSFVVGDVLSLTGEVRVDPRTRRPYINFEEGVHAVRRIDPKEVNPLDFVPGSTADLDRLLAEANVAVQSVRDTHLNGLLRRFYGERRFVAAFRAAPATVNGHHNYMGGALEHTVGVLRACEALCRTYPELDRELLVTAALLHDCGKVEMYTVGLIIDTTSAGRFLGHVQLGVAMVDREAAKVEGFPEELKLKLHHTLQTHHFIPEKEEEGRRAKIPEATALLYACSLDANVKLYMQELEAGEASDEDWVFSRAIGGQLYRK